MKLGHTQKKRRENGGRREEGSLTETVLNETVGDTSKHSIVNILLCLSRQQAILHYNDLIRLTQLPCTCIPQLLLAVTPNLCHIYIYIYIFPPTTPTHNLLLTPPHASFGEALVNNVKLLPPSVFVFLVRISQSLLVKQYIGLGKEFVLCVCVCVYN